MGTGNFTEDFKRDTVTQITERGHAAKEVSGRLGVSTHSHYAWKRKLPRGRADEDRLVAKMIELARQYSRYGYRRIAALLRGRRMPFTGGR